MRVRSKILVVDDDMSVLNATASVLTHGGFDVITATNPDEAIRVWAKEKNSIHAVIADLDLQSHFNGQELCDLFSRDEPGLLTILLTGHSLEPRNLGRIDQVSFFYKPYDSTLLLKAVWESLSGLHNEPRTVLAFAA